MKKTGEDSSFFDRLVERMDLLDHGSLQSYILKLSRRKGFLETIFNTIQQGIVVIDQNLFIEYVNSAAGGMLGINEEAAGSRIDKYLREIDWRSLLNADPEQWYKVSRQEIEIFYPKHRYLSFYIVPVQSESCSETTLATLIFNDVTSLHEKNEQTVESQKVEAITMLAAGVAHELGNPLNSLNIHLQLMNRLVRDIDDDEIRDEAAELMDIASGEVSRLDRIVKHFLQAVRPGKMDRQPIHIEEILAESLAFMRKEIEDRNIMVEAALSDVLPVVYGDADQLKQAFFNIIKNAVQAMPDGGELSINCDAQDIFLEISFSDTGKGIPMEQLRQLTDPYFTTRKGGTGLGLMIVDRIVRDHGGELGIESSEGRGTVFTIRLPLGERRIRLLEASPVETIENVQEIEE